MSANRRNMPRNHVLEIPLFVSIIRVIQFVFAIILLGLSAYGVSQYSYDGFGLTLFTSPATMVIIVYILIATEFYSLIYNYWAILGLDIFLVIFWLCSFSVTAANAHSYGEIIDDFAFYGGYYFSTTYRNTLRVTAVFGAFEFIMFCAALAFTAVFLHSHRKAGGHCMPMPMPTTAENVEMKKGPDRVGPDTQSTPYGQPTAGQDVPPV